MEEQQAVDSSKPGFVMPDNWHWRKVDANNGPDHIVYGFRLVGWDPTGQNYRPYLVTDEHRVVWWFEHIRFTDGDTYNWSDDDAEETC